MPTLARAALLGVLALAFAGLINPALRPLEIQVPPDKTSHALIIYAVTLLAILSFPRLRPLWIGLVVAALAASVEIAQLAGVLFGAAQVGDLAADALGISMALLPLAATRTRSGSEAMAMANPCGSNSLAPAGN